jgi:hypothetical protein
LALFTLGMTRETYHLNNIVDKLKAICGGKTLPNSEHMPIEYLEAIISDLPEGLALSGSKVGPLANRADSVWRKFRQQAPKLGSSLVLLGAYVAIFLVGIGGTITFFAAEKVLNERVVVVHRPNAYGQSILVEQKYWNNRKISEIQLNDRGFYDGPSTTWYLNGVKQRIGSWTGGYRDGLWTACDSGGHLQSITTYESGRPVRYQVSQDGKFVDVEPDQWPAQLKDSVQLAPLGNHQEPVGN